MNQEVRSRVKRVVEKVFGKLKFERLPKLTSRQRCSKIRTEEGQMINQDASKLFRNELSINFVLCLMDHNINTMVTNNLNKQCVRVNDLFGDRKNQKSFRLGEKVKISGKLST